MSEVESERTKFHKVRRYRLKLKIIMKFFFMKQYFSLNSNLELSFIYSKTTTETVEKGVKHVQS